MIGNITQNKITLPVTLRLPSRPDLVIEFVVDTGYEGYLTLPAFAIQALGLPFSHSVVVNLADDSSVRVAAYSATILWDHVEREVFILAMGKRPLLGTLLLAGNDIQVRFQEGENVFIDPVPDL